MVAPLACQLGPACRDALERGQGRPQERRRRAPAVCFPEAGQQQTNPTKLSLSGLGMYPKCIKNVTTYNTNVEKSWNKCSKIYKSCVYMRIYTYIWYSEIYKINININLIYICSESIHICYYIYIYIYSKDKYVTTHQQSSNLYTRETLQPSAVGQAERGGIDWGGDTSGYWTKPQKTIQSPNRLYKAPKQYTKPRQTSQSPQKVYKDIKY